MEKHGAKNFRLLAALVAGEATGSLARLYESDDFASSGAGQDNFFSDPDGMALMAKATSSASPNASYQSTLWLDVPL